MQSNAQHASTELSGIPADGLKARVLNTVYEMEHLRVLDGYQLLAAQHLKTNVGIYVVAGNFGREHFKVAVEEARKAGLNTQRFYVYATTATYSGNAICVTQFDDIWPGCMPIAMLPSSQESE